MSVTVSDDPVIVTTALSVAISQLIQVTASASNPAYLILNVLDRNEYTIGVSGATGVLNGNGASLGLTTTDADARETGLVFGYQPSTMRYFNTTFGYLDQLTYLASSSAGDITDLSLFASSSLNFASHDASNTFALIQSDAAGYLGTATIATLPGFSGSVPAQATPQSIAAIADSFIGQAWNINGCWTLTSTIAAQAGASLPIQSTIYTAGQANGEWFVAYNGPASSAGDWQSTVRTGDMVEFVTAGGQGHITTCVSGSGSSAQVVDNIAYVDQYGAILNPANDGSAADVVIKPPHAASEEWAGVSATTVVIYRLDTPVMTKTTTKLSLDAGGVQNLGGLFSATDAAGKAVTGYQIYNTNAIDTLFVGGSGVAARSAATAAFAASLSSVDLQAGQAGGSDLLSVRASNGAYWGDWTTLSVTSAAAPIAVITPAPTLVPTPALVTTPALVSSQTLVSTPAPVSTPTPVPTPTPVAPAVAPANAVAPISSDTVSVYRFFDTGDGTHFFTASTIERDGLIASRPDLSFEGVGLAAVSPTANDPAAEAVYRFFDSGNGTHFFTADVAERDSLIATRPGMTFEGAAFYEHAIASAGDSAVYRFFDSVHGTHLYTENAAERATIQTTRPDLAFEGIAFYAPSIS